MLDANSVPGLSVAATCGGVLLGADTGNEMIPSIQVESVGVTVRVANRAASVRRFHRPVVPPHDALVDLIRSYVIAHIHRPIGMAEFVKVTGVSDVTLRRAIATETGQNLFPFATNVRLDRVHALLLTARESRSVTELAHAFGYASAPAFAKAYRSRFGESVSVTRRRAVYTADPSIHSRNMREAI